MTVVTHELGLTSSFNDAGRLRQLIIVGDEDLIIGAIRPYLTKYGSAAGSLIMRVTDTSGANVAQSAAVLISDISSQNFHGKVRFLLDVALRRRTSYYLELVGSGYSYGASDFVGWNTAFDMKNCFSHLLEFSDGPRAPFSFEVWKYRQVAKGITQ